ncbi:MAG TPA: metallophosphoesterase family protein [Terriglobia bacterium]|nr:metallophosphoesterase family protein [Terriglobia bacterium]
MIGLISDTHGLVRPEVLPVFAGATLIIHAGDIGSSEVLKELKSIAPVIAVRGNNDKGGWASGIPETEVIKLGNVSIYVLHDLKEIKVSPRAAGFQVVVSGHSHRPLIEKRESVLYVNPGSAGPRRFKLPVTVARLTIEGASIDGELVELSSAAKPSTEEKPT